MAHRLPSRLRPWHPLCEAAGEHHGLDPLLLLAIIDIESLGGLALKPRGPHGVGDGGHGRGLMQIDDRYHKAFIEEQLPDGSPAWANPEQNIDAGAALLAANMRALGSEFLAVAAYNAGVDRVAHAVSALSQPASERARERAADAVTTHGDYASRVRERRRTLRIALNLIPGDSDDEPTAS